MLYNKNIKLYEYIKTFLHYRRPILTGFLKYVKPDSLILDFGCGPGNWSQYLEKDLGFKVVGIDFSKESVYSADNNRHRSGLDASFIIGDVRTSPFKNDSFYGIFSSDVLGHIVEVDRAIKEISRVLKSGGTAVIFAETNGYIGKSTYQDYVIKRVKEDPWVWIDGHVGLRSYKELKEIIEKQDMEIKEVRFLPYNHLIFSLLLPLEYDYGILVDKYPVLRNSIYLKIVHMSALMRKRIFIYNALCHIILKIMGTMFIYLNHNIDYGGVFFKLTKK